MRRLKYLFSAPKRRSLRNLISYYLLTILSSFPRRVAYKNRVIIFKPDRLGDAVLALGAIRRIIETYPNLEPLVVCSRPGYEIFSSQLPGVTYHIVEPFVDDPFYSMPSLIKFVLIDFRRKFSVAISLRHQRTFWQELLWRSIDGKSKFACSSKIEGADGFDEKIFSNPKYTMVDEPFDGSSMIELSKHAAVIGLATGRKPSIYDILPRFKKSCDSDHVQNGRTHTVLIFPFGSTPIRDIPLQNIVFVVKKIQEEHPDTMVKFIYNPIEEKRYDNLKMIVLEAGLINTEFLKTNTIDQVCSEIQKASVVLSTETGPAHIAVAHDIHLVGVLGGGHYNMFAPWSLSQRQIWLSDRLDCFNCNWKCTRKEVDCISNISGKQIGAAVCGMIEKQNSI